MTFIQLKYVITIAQEKSFNKAAEVLFLAQPSLTSAIQELEKELGIMIFNRSKKGVTLTGDGMEFLSYARQLYEEYENLLIKYQDGTKVKKRFGVSTQHYSFAVKAFVDMAKLFDMSVYEFAIRETKTFEVIQDVSTLKSEIGILYLSDSNKKPMEKLFQNHHLEFHPLIQCKAFVYLWHKHPLAKEKEISFQQLLQYPCLSFEQGEDHAFYFQEEILGTKDYPKIIKVNDRATMLNLMVGLHGYTLCSGIISKELNGEEYVTIPFLDDANNENSVMEIGYIKKKNMMLSPVAEEYIQALKSNL